jgi:hypothetical protein
MYNVVDDPLARMSTVKGTNPQDDAEETPTPKAPDLISAPLSDLLTLVAKRHDERLKPSGVMKNPTLLTLFALALPVLAYTGLTTRVAIFKPILLAAAGLTVGMALLTGSRQTLLAILLVSIPLILKFSKRPVVTLLALGIGGFGVSYIIGMADQTALDRFSEFDSERIVIWELYFRDVFMQRPLFGLLGVSGEEAFKSSVVGMHPHSAYLNMMYMGGLSYLIPMLWLLWKSITSTIQVWKSRSLLGCDPLIISILAMLLASMYIQGLFNQVVYWPTYTWSFLHIILACFFISVARDLTIEDPAWVLPDDESEDDDVWDEDVWDEDAHEGDPDDHTDGGYQAAY